MQTVAGHDRATSVADEYLRRASGAIDAHHERRRDGVGSRPPQGPCSSSRTPRATRPTRATATRTLPHRASPERSGTPARSSAPMHHPVRSRHRRCAGAGAKGVEPGPATKATVAPSSDTSTSPAVTDAGRGRERRVERCGPDVGGLRRRPHVSSDLRARRPRDRRAVERQRRRSERSAGHARCRARRPDGRAAPLDTAQRSTTASETFVAAVAGARDREATTHPLPLIPGAALRRSAVGVEVPATRSRIQTLRRYRRGRSPTRTPRLRRRRTPAPCR